MASSPAVASTAPGIIAAKTTVHTTPETVVSPPTPPATPPSPKSYFFKRILRPSSMDATIKDAVATEASQQKVLSSESTKRDATPVHPADSHPGVTFAHQKKLSKLPIPELEDTCKKYLDAMRPLQSRREHAETKAAVREFLENEGPELNERLKAYAEGQDSYIEQFCEFSERVGVLGAWANGEAGYDSYLNYDNPVVLNLNPFFLLEDDPTPARNNQVTRAASLVASALAFVRALRMEELPPDKIRGTPLCMVSDNYRKFGTID